MFCQKISAAGFDDDCGGVEVNRGRVGDSHNNWRVYSDKF